MAHDVFLCYNPSDRKTATAAKSALKSAGIYCYDPIEDTTSRGDAEVESLAAVSSARVLLYLYTDDANMDSDLIKFLDAARKEGTEIVTLRLSNSMPLGRIGYYMTIPFTVDAREGDLETHLPILVEKVKETLSLVDENRAKTPGRWEIAQKKDPLFKLPGLDTNKWYLSLIVIMIYVLSVVVIVMTFVSLKQSPSYTEDLIAAICLVLLFAVPVMLLGNLFGLRDKLPLLKNRKPLQTIAAIFLLDAAIFFLFDLILYFVIRRGSL